MLALLTMYSIGKSIPMYWVIVHCNLLTELSVCELCVCVWGTVCVCVCVCMCVCVCVWHYATGTLCALSIVKFVQRLASSVSWWAFTSIDIVGQIFLLVFFESRQRTFLLNHWVGGPNSKDIWHSQRGVFELFRGRWHVVLAFENAPLRCISFSFSFHIFPSLFAGTEHLQAHYS